MGLGDLAAQREADAVAGLTTTGSRFSSSAIRRASGRIWILLVAAVAAAYVPARRASAIDPLTALRSS